MRGIRFWLIGVASFITVTVGNIFVPGSLLNRLIAVLTCAIFSASSTVCITNLSGRAIAIQPDTPAFTSSAKQLDADHAEIRLNFSKGCEFISHLTKTPEGIIQDSLQFSHNNLKACGIKPFTIHYSNVGKIVEIQIQGQNERLRLEASTNQDAIIQTYQDASGKVQQQSNPIPKEILDYLKTLEKKPLIKERSATLPNSRDSDLAQIILQPWLVASNNVENLYSPNSAEIAFDLTNACDWSILGDHLCNLYEVMTGYTGFAGWLLGLEFSPILGAASLITSTVCWVLYGGFPPIASLWESRLKTLRDNERVSGYLLLNNPNPLLQQYATDINHLLSTELPRVQAGNVVTNVGQAIDAYLEESKIGGVLQNLLNTGILSNFLKDCKNQKLTQANSTNDPHLVTFDGLKYDLQTVGEFILVQSNDGAFNLQARQSPYNNSASISINSAVAMKVGSDRVAFYAQGFPDADTSTPLRVNGKPTKIKGEKLKLDRGEILKQGNSYVVNFPTGEKVLVSPTTFSNNSFLNISAFVYNRAGKYSGLLGNVNGKPNDDQQIRGGGNVLKVQSTYGDVNKVLNQVGLRLPGALERGEKVYFDQLYKEFANSWRVKQEESLFDYPAGKTTKNYLDPSFPDQYLKLDMLSPEQIQNAQNACTKAKVTQDLMEGCIFDVGFSGFSEFARATSEINDYVNIVNQLFPGLKIPTTGQFIEQIIPKKPKVCAFGICL